LEVGCGSGFVICSVALAIQQLQQQQQQQQQPSQTQTQLSSVQPQSPAAAAAGCSSACRFFATDINPAALQATAQTLAAHKVGPFIQQAL
jgi:methylase of polypeptide subunit release factors